MDLASLIKSAGADKPKQTRPVHANHVGYYLQYRHSDYWFTRDGNELTFREAQEVLASLTGSSYKWRIVAIVEVS